MLPRRKQLCEEAQEIFERGGKTRAEVIRDLCERYPNELPSEYGFEQSWRKYRQDFNSNKRTVCPGSFNEPLDSYLPGRLKEIEVEISSLVEKEKEFIAKNSLKKDELENEKKRIQGYLNPNTFVVV